MTARRLSGEDGFTLPELLVAFALLALALTAIVGVQYSAQRAYLTGDRKAEVQQNARFALERLASEIRQATAVTAASASSITFTGPDGVAVTYTLNEGSVTRNDVALIGGVAAFDVRVSRRQRCRPRRARGRARECPACRRHDPDPQRGFDPRHDGRVPGIRGSHDLRQAPEPVRRAGPMSRSRLLLDERGMALPLALITLVLLTSLTVAFVSLSATEPLIVANLRGGDQALAVAEAAVERARWALGNAAAPASGLTSPLPTRSLPRTPTSSWRSAAAHTRSR